MAGLAKDPDQRPASAVELIRRARQALGETVLDPPAPRLVQRHQSETVTSGLETMPVPPKPKRRARVPIVAAALAGLVIGGAVVALLDRDKKRTPVAPAPLPAPPAGTERLGPELTAAGRTMDCKGKPVSPSSPNCTIFQERLAPDTTLVVPRNGSVVRWGVRGASGELALAVLRRDGDEYFQIARSRTEFISSPEPQFFKTDVLVEQGDRLGLVLVAGSGVGIRAAEEASTGVFIPSVGVGEKPAIGVTGELLFNADLAAGRVSPEPAKLFDAEAESAPKGEVYESGRAKFPDGSPVEVQVAVLDDGRGVLDLIEGGRRTARIEIPDFLAGSRVLSLELTPIPPKARRLGVGVLFTQEDSQRLRERYFYADGPKFKFLN